MKEQIIQTLRQGIGHFFLVFSLFIFSNTYSWCQVPVGSGLVMPVPTLQDALDLDLVDLVAGVITDDLIIYGDFDFDVDCIYRDADIKTNTSGSMITISETGSFENVNFLLSKNLIFLNLRKEDPMVMSGGSVNSTGAGNTILIDNRNEVFFDDLEISNLNVDLQNHVVLETDNTTIFDNAPITLHNAPLPGHGVRLRMANSVVKNAALAVNVLGGGSFGHDNLFENCGTVFNLDANLLGEVWEGGTSTFRDITGTCVEGTKGNSILIIGATFERCTTAIDVKDLGFHANAEYCTFSDGQDGILISNCANVELTNNTFTNMTNIDADGLIQVSDCIMSPVLIEKNTIDACDKGIQVSNSVGVSILENTITDVASSDDFGVINMENLADVTVEDNDVSAVNTVAPIGYFFNTVVGSEVLNNDADNLDINVKIIESTGMNFEGNNLFNAGDDNLFSENNSNIIYGCNRLEGATNHGASFYGNNMLLNFVVNRLEDNDIGLYYGDDMEADAQLERGNRWITNVRSGAQNDNADDNQVEESKYVVIDIPEYNPSHFQPNHDPAFWFDETGLMIADCILRPSDEDGDGLNPFADERQALITSITCDSVPQGEGYCLQNKMIARRLIDLYPDLLTNSTELTLFYNNSATESWAGLPLTREILDSLPYSYMESTFPAVELDSNGVISNLDSLLNYVDPYEALRDSLQQERLDILNDYITQVQSVTPSDQMEIDYKALILIYLDQLLNGTDLTTQEISDIETLAESCIGTHGPAVYLARSLAYMNSISITENYGCNVSRSSLLAAPSKNDTDFVYPNPSNGRFYVYNLKDCKELFILNELGQNVKKVKLSGEHVLELDMSDQLPGIYFIQSATWDSPKKIVLH